MAGLGAGVPGRPLREVSRCFLHTVFDPYINEKGDPLGSPSQGRVSRCLTSKRPQVLCNEPGAGRSILLALSMFRSPLPQRWKTTGRGHRHLPVGCRGPGPGQTSYLQPSSNLLRLRLSFRTLRDRLRARHPKAQRVEAVLACNALNRMFELGRPLSKAIRT